MTESGTAPGIAIILGMGLMAVGVGLILGWAAFGAALLLFGAFLIYAGCR